MSRNRAQYLVNGLFLTERINGVQRYGTELLNCLDSIIAPGVIEVLLPRNTKGKKIDCYENIRIRRYGRLNRKLWEQIDYPLYAKIHHMKGITFTNVVPLMHRKGIVVLHDVIFKARPDFFNGTVRGKISIIWRRLNYLAIKHSTIKIVTVSEFSKSEIEKYYNIDGKRISVIKNSWQHMNKVDSDNTIFERKNIKPMDYYFSMATVAKNKNFAWILECAKSNPTENFLIAGGGDLNQVAKDYGFRDLHNVLFLGYVTDEEAKALMQSCKAFLFPTLYEGFGIPPLEAVACGAKQIIVSDTPCMKEIYNDFANYIDPKDADSFDTTIDKKDPKRLLEMYSWEQSAQKLWKLIERESK